MNNKTKEMVYAALLTALAIIIPIQFKFLAIRIEPFSATLAAHVPMFIAMLISPMVAMVVGVGSTLGFLFSGVTPAVVARAATHIVVGYIGAKIISKTNNFAKAAIITAPIHGGLELLVSIPFVGLNLYTLLIVTGVGAVLHHCADAAIAYVLAKALASARRKTIYTVFGEFKEVA